MRIPNYRDQIKVVFFDIDETLLIKDQDHLPETVLPAIQKLKANGIIPAIATGRTPCNYPPKIKALIAQANMDLLVSMNGQYVSYQGKILDKNPLPREKIQQVVDFFDDQQIEYAFVAPHCTCVSAITEKVRTALDPLKGTYHVDKQFFHHNEVFQILGFYDRSQDALVNEAGVLDGLQQVRWHKESVDLFDHNGSKSRGILVAIRHLGLSMENVMAFGDGLNDIEMLTQVGVGVAMGNAHEEVKKIARHITKPIDQAGIHYFLEQARLLD